MGTEATQLAMLEGLGLQGRNLAYSEKTVANHILDSEITRKQKRLRTEIPSCRGSVGSGDCIEKRANVVRHRSWSTGGDDRQSRRLSVASAPISGLPNLPRPGAKNYVNDRTGEKTGGSTSSNDDGGDRNSRDGGEITVVVREEGEEERVYRCEQGAPCDEVYCSVRCRRMALEAGHALICVGGGGEGRWVPAVELIAR